MECLFDLNMDFRKDLFNDLYFQSHFCIIYESYYFS